MKEQCRQVWKAHNVLCSWILTAALLFLAYAICATILHFTRIDNDAPVVFVLAVVVISRITYHMYYGIVASIVSTFAINYFLHIPTIFYTEHRGLPH